MRRSLARLLFIVALLCAAAGLLAATARADPGDTLWTRMLGTSSSVSSFEHVAAAPNGDVVVTGQSQSGAIVVRYASSGKRRWLKQLGFGDPKIGQLRDVACDTHGDAVTACQYYVDGASDTDWLIMKFDPAGRLLWKRQIDGGNKGTDVPVDLALDTSGNVCVTGSADAGAVCMNVKLRASDGRVLWKRLLSGADAIIPVAMTLDGNNTMYVAGKVFLGAGNWKLVTLQISATGYPGWRNEHTWIGGSVEPIGIATGGGALYVAGTMYTGGPSSYDPLLIKYRLNNGDEIWSDFFDAGPALGTTTTIDQPRALAVDGKGNAFVAGEYEPMAGGLWRALAIKWAPDKTRAWVHSNPVVAGSTGLLNAVAADGVGGCYVSGTYAGVSTPVNAYVAHYAATGKIAWQHADFAFTDLSDSRAMTLVPGGRICTVGAWRWDKASADIWGLIKMRKR